MSAKYIPPHLRPGFQPAKPANVKQDESRARFRSSKTGLPSSNIHIRFFNTKDPELTQKQVAILNSQKLGQRKIRATRRTLRSALKGSKKHGQRLAQSASPRKTTRKRRASL
jgi:hypothetical protein